MLLSLCLLMVFILSGTSGFLEQLEKPEVREIKARLEEEKAKRLLLQNDVEMLMLKVAQLERKYDDDSTKATHGVTGSTEVIGKIAFTARLTATTTLDMHHVVKFDQVLHNHGNAYSANTGVFKAPFNGTFVFSLSALSGAKNLNFHISIMKNAAEIGRLFSGSTVNGWYEQGSITVVTSLSENDEVYVWGYAASSTLHGNFYCSFTGFEV